MDTANQARDELVNKKYPFIDKVIVEQFKNTQEESWHPILVVRLKEEITQAQRDSIGTSLKGIPIITETPEVIDFDSLPPDLKEELMKEEEEGSDEDEEDENK